MVVMPRRAFLKQRGVAQRRVLSSGWVRAAACRVQCGAAFTLASLSLFQPNWCCKLVRAAFVWHTIACQALFTYLLVTYLLIVDVRYIYGFH